MGQREEIACIFMTDYKIILINQKDQEDDQLAGVLRVEDSVSEQEILEASNTKDQHEQRKA